MEFKVHKKNLLEDLYKFQTVVERKSTMPILMNILMKIEKDELKMSATNLEVSLVSKIPVHVIKPGVCTVNCKNLFEIIKELPEEELHLKKEKNHWLSLKTKQSNFSITGMKEDDFPVFPKSETDNKIKIDSKFLLDILQKTIYAVSLDETRYHLSGVYLELGEKQGDISAVATDGHRMSLYKRGDFIKKSGMIVPKKGIYEIRKLLESFDGDIFLTDEKNQLIVCVGNSQLMVRLIDGKYPEYKNLIPENLDKKIDIDIADFLQCLKRVSVLVNKKSKGVGVSLGDNRIKVATLSSEEGSAEEFFEVSYEGEKVEIGFNVRYIIDVLQNMRGSKVSFSFKDSFSPVSFVPEKDSSHICIVMPMRI